MTDLSRLAFINCIANNPPVSALFSFEGAFIRFLSESYNFEPFNQELQHIISEVVKTQHSLYRHIIDANCQDSVMVYAVPIESPDAPPSLIVTFFNMSGIENYQHDAELLDAAVEMIEEAVVITDAKNRILRVNKAFQKLTGYAIEELEGKNPSFLSSGITSRKTYQQLWHQLLSVGHWSGEIWDRRKDGSTYPKWLSATAIQNKDGVIINFIGVFTDISKEKETEKIIDSIVHYDVLTQLPNRIYIKEQLMLMAPSIESSHHKSALLLVGLDRFKLINDSMGHTVGDRIIIESAERIRRIIRKNDIVARLGGDEFLVVLPIVETISDATDVAKKILEAFIPPYLISDQELYISASIGINFFPSNDETIDTAIQHAESAMYAAKQHGGKNFELFNPLLNEAVIRRMMIENDLQRAIANEEFHLVFQPQIDPHSGNIKGVEALIRWTHPVKGLISPIEFIPIAEETGLILQLGMWIIRDAMATLKRWLNQGLGPIRMAINISARQFTHPDFVGIIRKALEEFQIPAHLIELEVTESAVMEDPSHAIQICEELQEDGIEFAIDDFGTGYSSLGYLKLFPVKRLKIDKTFVDDIGIDTDSSTLAEIIIALAKSMKLEVIAEGVETVEQLSFLKALGCNLIQGYFFSPPQDEATIISYLIDRPFEDKHSFQKIAKRKS